MQKLLERTDYGSISIQLVDFSYIGRFKKIMFLYAFNE
ncbi:MAG: hypothetical protein RLZZ419_1447 [Pseudomonadota bacterium]|jgi:hypothetical protein